LIRLPHWLQYCARKWFFMPQPGQCVVSLRLGIATNGPFEPSIILRSRTTKQLSNVIEQNALRRSPGSSISLMRTSVISTVVLLALHAQPIGNSEWRRRDRVAVYEVCWPNAVRVAHGDKRQSRPIRCL